MHLLCQTSSFADCSETVTATTPLLPVNPRLDVDEEEENDVDAKNVKEEDNIKQRCADGTQTTINPAGNPAGCPTLSYPKSYPTPKS